MNPKEIISAAQSEALVQNEQSASNWATYQNDLKTTQHLLTTLPEKLSENVMVPLGPKAMMRGKIVHTNEFLVCIGDGYFIKQSAKQARDICERKIQNCGDMLDRFEKERNLLLNKLSMPGENDAFGAEERPEIVEHVSEEDDKEWRKEHRQREKEYRQKLADMKNKEKTKIESEEDLWSRLDELELEEELEDELNRIHQDNGSEEDEEEDENIEEPDENIEEPVKNIEESTENTQETINKDEAIKNKLEEIPIVPVKRRSVVFMDKLDVTEDKENTSTDIIEPLYLHFKHTPTEPATVTDGNFINSPSDIYHSYQRARNSVQPHPILRVRVNPNQKKELDTIKNLEMEEEKENRKEILPQVVAGITIPAVVERIIGQPSVLEPLEADGPPRRISKFKVSRLKQRSNS